MPAQTTDELQNNCVLTLQRFCTKAFMLPHTSYILKISSSCLWPLHFK